MPGRNGTGPAGRGPGMRRGIMRQQFAGPVENCICPICKTKVPHQPGVPCSSITCPECGTPMTRE